jgi:methyl-accepting chemotaxis protein
LTAQNSGRALDKVALDDVPLAARIADITTSQLQQSIWLYRGLLGGQLDSQAAVEEAVFEYDELGASIQQKISSGLQNLNGAMDRVDDEELRARLLNQAEQLTSISERYQSLYNDGRSLLSLLQDGQFEEAELNLPMVEIDVEDMSAELLAFNNEIAAQTSSIAIAAATDAESSGGDLLWITIVAFAVALVFGWLVVRSVSLQLGADPEGLARVAEDLAEGRLTLEVSESDQGVYQSIGQTVSKLRQVIRTIKSGAAQVATASQQVLQGNTDLSSRTQEQASSLEEIAASMEEMAGTVNQNAENAQQAEQLAKEAQKKATEGSQVVGEAVTAMDMIDASSSRITEILEMIEEIAFQTNLLALNAAVEAARAGEQGRGFAVVANEVRALAGRSSTAAKDIKNLIQESITNVNNGMKLVNNSGAMLHEIVNSVRGVTEMVTEIAAASVEQSDGIAQVNKAVIQMEGMTQQNAALVEEAAAASQSMGDEARDLSAMVAFFQLNEEDDLGSALVSKDSTKKAASKPESSNGTSVDDDLEDDGFESLADDISETEEDGEWTKF